MSGLEIIVVAVVAIGLCGAAFCVGRGVEEQKQHARRIDDLAYQDRLLRQQHVNHVAAICEQHDRDLADLRQRIVEYLARRTKLDEDSGLPASYAWLRAQMDLNSVPLRVERKETETGETA